MREIGMLPKLKRKTAPVEPLESKSSSWVRAPQSGLFRATAKVGVRVTKGDTLGVVADAFFVEVESDVEAPFTGIIIGRANLPVISEGDALYHVARFEDSTEVANNIQTFHEEHIEGLGPGDYNVPSAE